MKKAVFLVLSQSSLLGLKSPPTPRYSKDLQGTVFMTGRPSSSLSHPYVYLREADIIWTKRIWRVIDMREKMNQPFYYPEQPQNGWRSFVQIIMDGIKEGTITAYSVNIRPVPVSDHIQGADG